LISAGGTFRRVFGYEAQGLWEAPGRVNLIGEHTDYNQGLVLPFAIAERTEAAISPRNDGHIRVCSEQNPGEVVEFKASSLTPGLPSGWAAYVAGVPWALECDQGFDVAVDSSVPVGSGLSSSAALMCAVGLGINDLFDLGHDRREIARRTQSTENDYVGAPTGGMDQIASLLCTEGHAILYDVRADTTELIPFDPGAHGLEVLAVDSRPCAPGSKGRSSVGWARPCRGRVPGAPRGLRGVGPQARRPITPRCQRRRSPLGAGAARPRAARQTDPSHRH